MAWSDVFEGGLGTGLVVALGAAVVAPLVAPLVGNVLRPAAKGAIKAGLYAYDRGREATAGLNEAMGDIVAEARAEMEQPPARAEPRRKGSSHPEPAAG